MGCGFSSGVETNPINTNRSTASNNSGAGSNQQPRLNPNGRHMPLVLPDKYKYGKAISVVRFLLCVCLQKIIFVREWELEYVNIYVIYP